MVILEPDEVVLGLEIPLVWLMMDVLVVVNVAFRKSPKPTIKIRTMTMRADTPREIALFAFANAGQPEMEYARISNYTIADLF